MKTRHESNREGKPPRLGSVRTVWLRAAVVKRFIYTQSHWSHSFAHSFLHLADSAAERPPWIGAGLGHSDPESSGTRSLPWRVRPTQ